MALKYVEMTFLGVKCKALPYKRNVEHHHDHGRNYITLFKIVNRQCTQDLIFTFPLRVVKLTFTFEIWSISS